MLAITVADIGRAFPSTFIGNGHTYHRTGRVQALTVSNDGTVVTGQVKGSAKKPYRVAVSIAAPSRARRPSDRPIIRGRCSCPVGANCKHVVAVLFAALDRAAPSHRNGTAALSNGPAAAPPQPPDDIDRWLAALDQATQAPDPEAYPPDVRYRLIWRLSLETENTKPPRLVVEPVSVQQHKTGDLMAHTAKGIDTYKFVKGSLNVPKYVRPSDLFILRNLAVAPRLYGETITYGLTGDPGARLLDIMIETGRCRWQTPGGPALTEGPPRHARPIWTDDAEGRQRFRFEVDGNEKDGGTVILLPLDPLRYLDTETGACGRVETGLPASVASALLAAPAVPPERATTLSDALTRRFPNQPDLIPAPLRETRVESREPVPCLHVGLEDQPEQIGDDWPEDDWNDDSFFDLGDLDGPDEPVAELSFDYGGIILRPDDPRDPLHRVEDGVLISTPRNRATECEAWAILQQHGFRDEGAAARRATPPAKLYLAEEEDDQAGLPMAPIGRLLRFLHIGVPLLRDAGWRITVSDGVPEVLAEPSEDWSAEIKDEPSGIDWFGVSLGITVGEERLDLVPLLLPVLQALPADGSLEPLADLASGPDETLYVPLDKGRILPLPLARIQPLLAALYELYKVGGIASNGSIRLSAARLADLAELSAAAAATRLRWIGNTRLLDLGQRLRDQASIPPVQVPEGLQATLRPYQQRGLDWLQFLRAVGMGGVLADDMGLGKTVQAIAHLLVEKEAGRLDQPCLVVAPTSLMANWRREAARFAPALSVLTLQGQGRKAGFDQIDDHDLVLTTYALLPRDKGVLLAQDWHTVILDEAQAIKNPKAQATLVALQLKAAHRLCLTGTPLENNLDELWSLYQFLGPGLLGDHAQFKRVFRVPIEKQGNQDRQRLLARRVRPFLLRRTKSEVATELPDKTVITEPVELEGPQRDLYESLRVAMDQRVRAEIKAKGLAKSHITILDALLKLRQVCCDPRLVKGANRETAGAALRSSAKLSRLLELIEALIPANRRILLFSQFTTMLGLIETELATRRIGYAKLTGQTKDRETPVERFQSGDVPLFLISLKAGGTGLNLTAADTVILYDPWWNPAVERQAIDRAHRIGQDKAVFVHKLMTMGTVEETIQGLQAKKQALADGLFDPEAAAGSAWTEDELQQLFAPLPSAA